MSFSIQRRIIIFFSAVILILGVILAIMSLRQSYQNRLVQAQKRRYETYRLAAHLKMTADQLTRMARTYVVTGDTRYKNYYRHILAIRNGTEPRPPHYDEVFWDLITLNHDFTPARKGEAISLLDLMRRSRCRSDELARLKEAKKHADELTAMERNAFHLMDLADDEDILTDANRLAAEQLLFGEEYHRKKAAMMSSIGTFFALIDRRTSSEVEKVRRQEQRLDIMIFVLSALLLLLSLFAFLHSRWSIVRPLNRLIGWTQQIKESNYRIDERIESKDEIGKLAESFLEMADTIYENIHSLDRKAHSDKLTGLSNRRRMEPELERCHHAARFYHAHCALILCDIDHFKKINDRYGHNTGDRVIERIGRLLQNHLPHNAMAARWGGEEFLILLKNSDLNRARALAESLRHRIESERFDEGFAVTMSFGIALLDPDRDTRTSLEEADRALYRSKELGRNRVTVHQEGSDGSV